MNSDITTLSGVRQQALLEYLRNELPIPSEELPIRALPPGLPAPLSFAQERLLRQSLETSIPLYNESITVHRDGHLDRDVLQQSIAEVIRRHEIWRTSFQLQRGCLQQVVQPPEPEFALRRIDLRSWPKEERSRIATRLATQDASIHFDFNAGPLIRAMLIQMDDEAYRLAITAHLSVIDGVSAYQILPQELVTVYNAYSAGKESPLPQLAIQYRDYAYWQRHAFTREKMAPQLQYWRRQLSGELPLLEWPRPIRSRARSFRGATTSCTFPRELLAGIRSLRHSKSTTVFTVLQAVFATLLYGYTNQKDIIVGTFSPAGRKRSELQPLLGHLLNPVPLRIDLSDNPSFTELLKRTLVVTSDAISHDDVPLELLARELEQDHVSRNPFFNVGLSLQPRSSLSDDGWYVTSMDADNGGAMWDLYVAFIERPDALFGRIQYSSDLFEPAMIARLVHDFSHLMADAISDPEQPISELAARL